MLQDVILPGHVLGSLTNIFEARLTVFGTLEDHDVGIEEANFVQEQLDFQIRTKVLAIARAIRLHRALGDPLVEVRQSNVRQGIALREVPPGLQEGLAGLVGVPEPIPPVLRTRVLQCREVGAGDVRVVPCDGLAFDCLAPLLKGHDAAFDPFVICDFQTDDQQPLHFRVGAVPGADVRIVGKLPVGRKGCRQVARSGVNPHPAKEEPVNRPQAHAIDVGRHDLPSNRSGYPVPGSHAVLQVSRQQGRGGGLDDGCGQPRTMTIP